MKENSIISEKNYLKDVIYYPAYSINSGKITRKRRKYSLNYDVNNSDVTHTFDKYFLKNFVENNNIDNDNQQETNSNLKLYDYSDKNESESKINEMKYKKKKDNKDKKFKKVGLKQFGRKKKNSNEKGIHDKYSSDNIIRKCKAVLIQILNKFINDKIKEIYGKERNYNIKRSRLKKMNQFQVVNSNVKYNQQFLNKKLKDIFSEKISSRCTTYSEDHNKQLINNLLNEENKKNRKIFNDILNLTFIECLKHFRGSIIVPCLNDLKNYNDVVDEFKDEDYKESFKCYIDNFEEIIKNKKPRRNKKIIYNNNK